MVAVVALPDRLPANVLPLPTLVLQLEPRVRKHRVVPLHCTTKRLHSAPRMHLVRVADNRPPLPTDVAAAVGYRTPGSLVSYSVPDA
jgi:hypothetical protein